MRLSSQFKSSSLALWETLVMLLCCAPCFVCCLSSAVDCGRPQPLPNGSIIGDKTVYPNYVNHACDEGFILRGSPQIKCQTNGTWSRTSSSCKGKEYVRVVASFSIIQWWIAFKVTKGGTKVDTTVVKCSMGTQSAEFTSANVLARKPMTRI